MRFAILARVSSEEQVKGESIAVQIKTLKKCVSVLGGEIVKEFIGQESAMGVKERPILEEMLSDCSKDVFNALMVYDLSRLSRDPVKSKIIFATLKKNGIKLFIQSQEYDLTSPETSLIVGLLSEINQFSVNIQTKKAMASKIELARRGYPLSSYPHGRKLVSTDKNQPAVYEVMPEYREQAEEIYRFYVEENKPFFEIARIFDTTIEQIRLILFQYSGDEWIQKIKYEGRDEVIITKVPPLLTAEQIERAKAVAKSNKKFNSRKYQYLLGGRIKCGVCKMTYLGQSKMKKDGTGFRSRYYKHSNHFRTDICLKMIKVELVETAVIKSIHELFSSIDNLKDAIENALVKTKDRLNSIKEKIKDCEDNLLRLNKEKQRLVNAVLKGVFEDADIQQEMARIKDETLENEERLKTLNIQLRQVNVEINSSDLAEKINRHYQLLIGENTSIQDLDHDKQQLLIDWFFGYSKDTGIYLMKDKQNGVVFNVVGAFNSSYLGVIQKEWNNVLILGYQENIHQPFKEKNHAVDVDFKQLLDSLNESVDTYTKHTPT